jgi:hypothetical protein
MKLLKGLVEGKQLLLMIYRASPLPMHAVVKPSAA